MLDSRATCDSFLALMKEPTCDAFLKATQLINRFLQDEPFLPDFFDKQIRANFSKIKNVLMLLRVHSLGVNPIYSIYEDDYKSKFTNITIRDNPICYEEIVQWLDRLGKLTLPLQQEIIEFILEQMPSFLAQKMQGIVKLELQFLLRIFNKLEIKTSRSASISFDFLTQLQKIKLREFEKNESRENVIICAVIATLSRDEKGQGNLSAVLDEYLLGAPQQENIEKYLIMNYNQLMDMNEQQLLKIFKDLLRKNINIYVLDLLLKFSNILAREEEYFKLKALYSKLIIPILAKGAKYCVKDGVEESVLRICEFYVVGFNEHCSLGDQGIQYLLFGVENVTSENYRKRWAKLAFSNVKTQVEINMVERMLKSKGFGTWTIEDCKIPDVQYFQTWQITTRNIRKHKNYKRVPSRWSGIKNKKYQCYIISVVQALFHTKKLGPLLEKIKDRPKFVTNLIDIFRQLRSQESFIRVDSLQDNGPEYFALSQNQEDAQQYLLSIMNLLEENFKKSGLEKDFKRIFQITSKTEIVCNFCKHATLSNQEEYTHTVNFKEQLKLEYQEAINDFTCQKCKKQDCTKKTSITLGSEILIVHINRFSSNKGNIKKELANQKILRRISGYELVGMIFHIGRYVQAGHYVYYSKISRKRWVELNDQTTSQIDLDEQDELFQREFKAETTPYILFYQKTS